MSLFRTFRTFRTLGVRTPRTSLPRLSYQGRVSTRAFATGNPDPKSNPLLWIGCISLGGAVTYYMGKKEEAKAKQTVVAKPVNTSETATSETAKSEAPKSEKKKIDYQAVYNDIAELLDEDADYDDGSYGPVLLRLGWHSSGTFNKQDDSGGSNGGTMRFKAESEYAANNGLEVARELLHKRIKPKYPDISYGDLYTLGAVVGVQELGGPNIVWRPGRQDQGENKCTPDGRLPDGAKNSAHVKDIFYRMGFNNQEIVALTGAHVLGRCHKDRSGFDGPWQEAPTFFSNEYFKAITTRDWIKKDLGNGNWQWVDKNNPEIMMLPIEITMLEDKDFKPYFELYAKDTERFFTDFAAAFKKLIELGVPFKGDEPEYVFERLNM